jgi:hypothetical protein
LKKQKKYTSTSRTSAVIRRLCAAIVITSAVAVAAPLLSSCSMIPGYAEPEDQAVVTAIGFDVDGELLTVTVQLSEAGGEEIRAISGTGRSIDAAISAISASETRTLEVSHLAIVALGRGVDRSWFEGIVDFCKRNEEIPISAMLVSTSDARALLSLPDTSGYKLTGIITSERESSSLGVEARLYKVLNTILSDDPVFFLPHFAANGDGFELYGGKIFRGCLAE